MAPKTIDEQLQFIDDELYFITKSDKKQFKRGYICGLYHNDIITTEEFDKYSKIIRKNE